MRIDRLYSTGVKANVLFFEKKSDSGKPATKELWVYDLRTNKNFTLRQNPITDEDLREFVDVYQAENRKLDRQESKRFKCFSYSELMQREKADLDILWLKDDSLIDIDNLAKPEALASAILKDLEDAMKAFSAVEQELKP